MTTLPSTHPGPPHTVARLTTVLLIRAVTTVPLPVTLRVALAQTEPILAAVGIFGARDDLRCLRERHRAGKSISGQQNLALLTLVSPIYHTHCPFRPAATGSPPSGRFFPDLIHRKCKFTNSWVHSAEPDTGYYVGAQSQ